MRGGAAIARGWSRGRALLYRCTMRRPDFLGIGAQRAGTTWLHEMLSLHPRVFLPAQKELHFFDERPDFDGYQGLWNPVRARYHDMGSAADWRWYLEHFRACRAGQLAGEITPLYATLSEERVRLIARALPGIRAIYTLRDPVQRAWSNLRLSWKRHAAAQGGALTEELIHRTVFFPAKLVHGDYRRNTRIWEACLSPGAILYLFYDDLVREPQAVLDRVCGFLGIEPLRPPDDRLRERVNASPEREMPARIRELLTEHFAGQTAFIRERFGRVLRE